MHTMMMAYKSKSNAGGRGGGGGGHNLILFNHVHMQTVQPQIVHKRLLMCTTGMASHQL